MSEKRIKVDYLARVEGEGALDVRVSDGKVDILKFSIFEPPRLFEAWLQGRSYRELPDFVARICGICPAAYQMSAVHAAEDAFGIHVEEPVRTLRRLFYCGEWLESHLLHIYMLAAPDFLGYESAITMAKDHPEVLKRGLRMKRLGNDIVALIGGREVSHLGLRRRFLRRSSRGEDAGTHPPSGRGSGGRPRDRRVGGGSGSPRPHARHRVRLPLPSGRVSDERGAHRLQKGIDVSVHDYTKAFEEYQVDYSTALRSRVRERGSYFVGPLARINLNFGKLTPATREAAAACGVPFPNANPFVSIVARAIEVMHAMDEALQIVRAYRRPSDPYVLVRPRVPFGRGTGHGATEAPNGAKFSYVNNLI